MHYPKHSKGICQRELGRLLQHAQQKSLNITWLLRLFTYRVWPCREKFVFVRS